MIASCDLDDLIYFQSGPSEVFSFICVDDLQPNQILDRFTQMMTHLIITQPLGNSAAFSLICRKHIRHQMSSSLSEELSVSVETKGLTERTITV